MGRPPIFRPVQLTLVPDRVESFGDVATALRHTAHLCTKMAYQTEVTKNTFCLRVALVQHVFTRVVPLPLPPRHPQRETHCFWAAKHREKTLRHVHILSTALRIQPQPRSRARDSGLCPAFACFQS